MILLWSGEPGAESALRRGLRHTLCVTSFYSIRRQFCFYSDKFILMCLIKIHDNQPMKSVSPPLRELIKLQFQTDTLN